MLLFLEHVQIFLGLKLLNQKSYHGLFWTHDTNEPCLGWKPLLRLLGE